jgi:hypothetical protein
MLLLLAAAPQPPFFLALFLICLLFASSTATITTTTNITSPTTLSVLHSHAHAHRTSSPTTVLNPRQLQLLNHIYHQSTLRHGYPDHADTAQILTSHFPALLPNLSEAHRVVQYLLESAPVIIHLNIPRVLHHMLDDSEESHYYKNLFEMLMKTNSTHPRRFQAQSTLFAGMYDDAQPEERVKYGLLDVGFAKPFLKLYGYSHLELKPSVRFRCTYGYGDSGVREGAQNLSVFETLISDQIINLNPLEMKLVMVAAAAATGDREVQADVKQRLKQYDREQRKLQRGRSRVLLGKKKERPTIYIEAQIHGPVDLRRDLSALVVDKYHQGNATLVRELDAFTAKFGVPYRWTEEVVKGRPRRSKWTKNNRKGG